MQTKKKQSPIELDDVRNASEGPTDSYYDEDQRDDWDGFIEFGDKGSSSAQVTLKRPVLTKLVKKAAKT